MRRVVLEYNRGSRFFPVAHRATFSFSAVAVTLDPKPQTPNPLLLRPLGLAACAESPDNLDVDGLVSGRSRPGLDMSREDWRQSL